jgi:ELWxxDGT repeat protein
LKRLPRDKKAFSRLAVERLEDRLLPSANMVADLNTFTQGSYPNNITSAANTTFFTATTNSGNIELFKTDGTASGTVQLTSGSQLIDFVNLNSFNGKLFFQAYDSAKSMFDLWTSDGTVLGTTPFLAGGSNVQLSYYGEPMAVAGTKLYFQAHDSANGLYDLWVSDGTSAGTHPAQPGSATAPTNLSNFTNVNGKLFFINKNSSGNYELWTSSGTTLVQTFASYQLTNLTAVGSELYFEMYDGTSGLYALWKSDGTSGGTMKVGDVGVGTTNLPFASLTALGSKLFFQVIDATDAPNTGWALWTYNGTTITPFTYGGSANNHVQVEGESQMIAFRGYLYFEGDDTANGLTLWKSDGVSTNSNTGLLLSSSSAAVAYPLEMTVDGSKLYFLARNPADHNNFNDLWSTTGTSASTAPVQTSGYAQGIAGMTASGTKIFFQAFDVDANGLSPHGDELWVSDGTNAGTGMVADINTNTDDSNPENPNSISEDSSGLPVLAVGNEVFFKAFSSVLVEGTYLWQTDGTAGNTVPVQTSTGVVPTGEENVTAVGNTVFFTANGSNGYDLWTTGTGAKSAVEIFAGSPSKPFGYFASSNGTSFASLNGKLYFGAYDLAHSEWALWQSDGTATGTTVVADIDPNYGLTQLTVVGNNLFWQNYDSAHSTYALWEYNSSTGTASLVQDIAIYGISNLTAVGSNVFFEAYDPSSRQYALWTSNGTTTANLLEFSNALYNLTSFNNHLYFDTFSSSAGGDQLWTSDGTTANTTPFLNGNSQPVLVQPSLDRSFSTPFTIVGSKLYYANSNGQLGVTDGTAAGTVNVQDGAPPGTIIAQNVNYLTNDNGTLVFSASDSAHGTELWQSDGTATGTLLADDIVTGPGSSNPTRLAVAGNQVFFAANDVIHGIELWTATITPTVVTAGLSGPTDGVTEQNRAFVLTAGDSNASNNSAGFSFAINWGDGTSQTMTGQSGLSANHQYATVGNFTISVTATNLADSATSAAFNQTENITQIEIQNGNLALGGVAGNNAWSITKGKSGTGYFTATINGSSTPVISNYKPAAGMQVFLYSGNGTNTVSFNDAAVTSTDTFTLGTGFVTYNNATFVPQNPVSSWTINGSNAADTYTISGTLTATINAGSQNDTFKVLSGANLQGTINGGGGVNTLDYSGFNSSGVIVDLPLDSATAINGGANHGIAKIQNVTGSGHGGDILVGDGNANVFRTLRGHNIQIGGSGGRDTLTSGGSGDILIAGSTNYDTNIAALQFILGEWAVVKASTYATVIKNIEKSATDPLNASTVRDSGSPDLADTLNGKSGKTAVADWYFAHTAGGTNPNDTINNQFSGEKVTSI